MEILYKVLLDTLPKRLQNNYVKKFNTSIRFWHETGGGLDESVIQELQEKGYQIRRNGVSNYTLNQNHGLYLWDPYRITRTISNPQRISPAGSGCVTAF